MSISTHMQYPEAEPYRFTSANMSLELVPFTDVNNSQIHNPLKVHDAVYYAIAIFMFTIFVIGIIFNGVFIYVFLVDNKLKQRSNILLASLCFCGFLLAALAVPFVGASALARRWLFGMAGCIFHGFTVTALGLTQIGILTVLSFDKYITIVKNDWHQFNTNSATYLLLFGCMLYGFLLATYPLLGWNRYAMEDAHISCSIYWSGSSASEVSYSLCLLIFGLVIPVTVMVYSYSHIIVLVSFVNY